MVNYVHLKNISLTVIQRWGCEANPRPSAGMQDTYPGNLTAVNTLEERCLDRQLSFHKFNFINKVDLIGVLHRIQEYSIHATPVSILA